AVVILLAIAGFKRLSQFAAVCSPWMFPIFLAGAIATLPRLGNVDTLAGLWNVAETEIWNGEPLKARKVLTYSPAVAQTLDSETVSPELAEGMARAEKPRDQIKLASDASVSVSKPGELWRVKSGEDTYVIQKYNDTLRVSQVGNQR